MRGHIRKIREGTYQLIFYLGVKNGKKDWHRETFHGTEKEVEVRRAELVIKLSNRKLTSDKMTVEQLINSWYTLKQFGLAQRTKDIYKSDINLHILPYIGKVLVHKVKPMNFQELYTSLLTKGNRKTGKGLSRKSVYNIHTMLQEIFDYAVKDLQILKESPLTIPFPRPEIKPPIIWNTEQANQFLKTAEEHRLYSFFLLILTTGIRRGEAIGAKWFNLNFEKGVLDITKGLVPTSIGMIYGKLKSKSSLRKVLLPDITVEALKQYYKEQIELFGEVSKEDFIFTSVTGNHMSTRSLDRTFHLLVDKAGVPRITLHALRHTHATLLVGANVPLSTVQSRLGHADISSTMIYTHPDLNMQKQATNAMNELFAKKDC